MNSFANGDSFSQSPSDIIIKFSGKRNVLSSSALNGGLRTDLTGVFNHCDKNPVTGYCDMLGDTYEEHLGIVADSIGLARQSASGLSTAANLAWATVCSESFDGFTVTAIVSGGVVSNGRRAGDAATMWEKNGIYYFDDRETKRTSGTVNILLHIDANLDPGAMAKAMMVATEAKAATIVEDGYKSCYSDLPASGSGTDGVIVVSDMESEYHISSAGTDVKLGECIGKAVTAAVRDQLRKQEEYVRTHGHLT